MLSDPSRSILTPFSRVCNRVCISVVWNAPWCSISWSSIPTNHLCEYSVNLWRHMSALSYRSFWIESLSFLSKPSTTPGGFCCDFIVYWPGYKEGRCGQISGSHGVYREEAYAPYSRKGDVPHIKKWVTSIASEDSGELKIVDFGCPHPHYLVSLLLRRTWPLYNRSNQIEIFDFLWSFSGPKTKSRVRASAASSLGCKQ